MKERGNRLFRLLDRIAGVPLVYFFGLLKFRRFRASVVPEVKRVAFLMSAAIGDTILLSAAIRDFRRACPGAHLTLFTGASNREAAFLISGLDRIIELSITDPISAAKIIRKSGHYDLWFDFGTWARFNALLSVCADATVKIGFRTDRQYRHYIYDRTVFHSSALHELQNYKELIRSAGIGVSDEIPALSIKGTVKPDVITIHMFPGGTRSSRKEWPQQSWKELVRRLLKRGYRIFLTGSQHDRERALQFVAGLDARDCITIVAGSLDLQRVAELLKSSRLVISVNTGIMHLAAALGCNLVALQGPTSVLRWGPLNSNSIALSSSAACAPCLNLGFEYACTHSICLETISVDDVDDAAKSFLE